MERAGQILAKIKNSDTISPEDLARAAWRATVGKRIAAKASPKALVRGSLIVEVEDAIAIGKARRVRPTQRDRHWDHKIDVQSAWTRCKRQSAEHGSQAVELWSRACRADQKLSVRPGCGCLDRVRAFA